MLDLGALRLAINVDSKQATKDLDSFDKKGSTFKEKFSKAMGVAKTAAIGLSAGVTAGAAAIGKMVSSSADAGDRIDKLSQKLGMSKTGFQEWDYILSQNGISIDSMGTGMKSLTNAMTDANSTGGKALQELGLNLEGMNREEAFSATIAALQAIEDDTVKASMATDLFGKSGQELMPLLNQTAEGTEELRQNIHNLGGIMSDEAVNAGVVYGDTLADCKAALAGATNGIASEFMPVIINMLKWVVDHMPKIQSIFKVVFDAVGVVIGTTVNWIKNIIQWFKNLWNNNEELRTFITETWEKIKMMFQSAFEFIKGLFDWFVGTAKWVWENFGEEISTYIDMIWSNIKIIFSTVFDALKILFDTFAALFKGDWEGVWNGIKEFFSTIWEGIKEYLGNALRGMIDIITSIGSKMWDAGAAIFNSLWDGIKGVWESIASWVSEKVNWLIDKLAFWRSGKFEMSEEDKQADNNEAQNARDAAATARGNALKSHRLGLSEVPYDGYLAELHRGEMVLTQPEADRYQKNTVAQNSNNVIVNNYSPKALSVTESARLYKRTQRELAFGF